MKLADEQLFRLIRDYLTVYLPKQRSCSEHTIKAYRESINLMLQFFEVAKNTPLLKITFEMLDYMAITEFLQWLETNRQCSVSTRNHRLACIRSFFRYAAMMDPSLMACYTELGKVPLKKRETPDRIDFLSENALKAILSQPNPSSYKGARDLLYMIMLYDSGARNHELLNLKCDDLHMQRAQSSIVLYGKGRKTRIVPMMEKTVEHCQRYLNYIQNIHKSPSQYLFCTTRCGETQRMSEDNVARFIKQYAAQARNICPEVPERVYPHLFRHTRAMHLYRGGMPLVLIAEWLGHSQLESTMIYAHADTEMKRKAIEKATASTNPVRQEEYVMGTVDEDDLIRTLYGLGDKRI